MDLIKPQWAFISVFNKKGIASFARELSKQGVHIISTGGTAVCLKKAGLRIVDIEQITGFPEIMDGRVKSLHPIIHGGILALRDEKKHLQQAKKHGINLIDLVVVNLYPFQDTVDRIGVTEKEALQQIDIGGPSLLRSAGKNYAFVTVVSDGKDYKTVIDELKKYRGIRLLTRKKFAIKAFEQCFRYDRAIFDFLNGRNHKRALMDLHYEKVTNLRYGENPHQKAVFFRNPDNKEANVTNARVLQGKELSFNNILDADAAIELVKEFTRPTAAFIKHTNPCGVASSDSIDRAFVFSYHVDPMAGFGSVVALNRSCTKGIAEFILNHKLFVEIVAAPNFERAARALFVKRPNLRLLETGVLKRDVKRRDIRKVAGGILIQTADTYVITQKNLKIVSKKKPSREEIMAMLFAQNVVKHVKSNAIVCAKIRGSDEIVTGIGAGQMSRVDAVFIAVHKGGKQVRGSVLASDAFFPFTDGIELAHKAGIVSIIQPGGSIRDKEVIEKVDELGMSMVFTGIRSFKH